MKIAIQGHPTRGKEVIQILESLGGTNEYEQSGSNERFIYFINSIGLIYSATQPMFSSERRIYTLEEFEKEFPFKVGDKVIDHEGDVAIITGFAYIEEKLGYSLQYENGRGTATSGILKPYKEMKEERNITLTLDKAKEWYNKGGELREIALQAFTEQELNPLPRSWEEFAKLTKFTFISNLEYIDGIGRCSSGCLPNKSIGESYRIWAKYVALFQLEQLRDCWRQGWEPIWDVSQKYCIYFSHNEIGVRMCTNASRFLTFPTREMAEEFLECFRDLIEKAGDLI